MACFQNTLIIKLNFLAKYFDADIKSVYLHFHLGRNYFRLENAKSV